MFGAQSSWKVVYVDRNRLQFDATDTGSIVSIDVPPTLVRDISVIDRAGLEKLILTFLSGKKTGAGRAAVVLAESMCFFTVIHPADDMQKEAAMQQFFDTVPFVSVLKKVYPQENGLLLTASNREFVETLLSILARAGFDVACGLPASVLGQMGSRRWLDGQMSAYVRKNMPYLRGLTMDVGEQAGLATGRAETEGPKQTRPWLVMTFVGLVILLIILVFMRSLFKYI